MTSKTTRNVSILAAVAVAAIAAYWYWSPLLAMSSMRDAAQKKDADAFNQYVDYPKLRESLKGQFSARMADVVGKSSGSSDMERAGAAIGTMFGLALVDRMIDAMVRPEMVMRSMSEAKLQNPMRQRESSSEESGKREEVKWTIERKGVDRVIAFGSDDSTSSTDARVGFVFDRSGFASWKLTEIRLPSGE